MPQTADPRRVVGSTCWAKATSVSNDGRRILGVDAHKIWLRGTVLEVISVRSEGAQRATTWIKAKYRLGDTEKIKLINLQQLKKENPDATAASPIAPEISPDAVAATARAIPKAGAIPEASPNLTTAPAAGPAAAVPGTSQTEGTDGSNGSSVRIPVVTVHD